MIIQVREVHEQDPKFKQWHTFCKGHQQKQLGTR